MNANNEPCQMCGKPVNVKREHWMVEVLTDSLGWFPIGPECRKSVPAIHDGLTYGMPQRWPGR